MNKYLLQDISGDGIISITVVIAENKTEALCKAIKGIISDKILTVEDICENLGISLDEFEELKTYE
jgi:thiaminase